MDWMKSSYSKALGNCVEVRNSEVRDSKDPDGPILSFDGSTWGRFLAEIKKA
jgi:hypothetical protein